MDVGVWLRSLGLGEYEEKFRDNKIAADVLADLTEGDLAQLGLPLGDRKRLLKAIAGLAGPPSAATGLESVQARPPRPAALSTSAERRPHRAFGVVLLRLRIAKKGHEPIAKSLQHMPAKPGHRA